MTALAPPARTAPAPAPPPDAVGSAPTDRSRRRGAHRAGFWIVLGVIALLLAILSLAVRGGDPDSTPLGADNPDPTGARAVVQVLQEHGVEVRTASSLRELRSLTGYGPTTVLVSDPDAILTARRGEIATTLGTDTVWVQPGFRVLRRIAPGLALAGRSTGGRTLDASCGVAAADRAGGIRSAGLAVRLGSSGFTGCFPAGRRSYLMATSPGGDFTVLGSRGVLDNGHVDRDGNAALALGLLGRNPTLVWYLPGLDDLGDAAPPDLAALTPGWVTPVVLLAFAVTIVAGIWRGRRFGALVVEDLPVVVHARETMEGRARLYQRSASRLHALDALRVGTIGRLAGRLGLPRSADVREVADAVAEATRRERRATADLLVDRVPADDRELVAFAARLAELESALDGARPAGGASMPPATAETPPTGE